MSQSTTNRTKYWWLWPDFYEEKDARDAAMMGVIACSLIAVVTGFTFIYRYYIGGDVYQLLGGMFVFIINCVLGYGIFKMSRVASSTALILFLAEKIFTVAIQGKSLGIAPLLAWYLFQGNRQFIGLEEKAQSRKLNHRRFLHADTAEQNIMPMIIVRMLPNGFARNVPRQWQRNNRVSLK